MNRPVSRMNAHDLPTQHMESTPGNIHGSSRFIVKVQSAAGMVQPHMVYDKERSFMGFVDPNLGAGYHRTAAVIGNHGFMGRKIYLWAERIAHDRLRLYLDNRPQQGQSW